MDTSPHPEAPPPAAPHSTGLGAELRESLVLLGCAVAVTVGITTVAQVALSALA